MDNKSISIDEHPLIDNTPVKGGGVVITGPGKTIALVACVSQKLDRQAPAQDLYTSAWFLKASAYARQESDAWYILSAKYGLLAPDKVIEPYNTTLNAMPAAMRRTWALQILLKLHGNLKTGDRVIILAGKRYREYLIQPLEKWGCQIDIPLQGLGIGKQLSWLNKELARTMSGHRLAQESGCKVFDGC